MKNLAYEAMNVVREKKMLFCGIAVMAVLVGFLIGYIRNTKQEAAEEKGPSNLVVDTSATDEEEKSTAEALKDRNIYFAGMDNMTIDKDTVVRLENLKDNEDILISFTITDNDTGEELFKTDLIPSGMHIDWKPSDSLKAGTYELCYLQTPVWQTETGEYTFLTSAKNVATLTLTE